LVGPALAPVHLGRPDEDGRVGFRTSLEDGTRSITWPFVAVVADRDSLTVSPRFPVLGRRFLPRDMVVEAPDAEVVAAPKRFSTELRITSPGRELRLRAYGTHPLRLLRKVGWCS
jgi:hypothetical protein